MRTAQVAIQTQSEEGVKALFEDLREQMGVVVEFDEIARIMEAKRDPDAIATLRALQ